MIYDVLDHIADQAKLFPADGSVMQIWSSDEDVFEPHYEQDGVDIYVNRFYVVVFDFCKNFLNDYSTNIDHDVLNRLRYDFIKERRVSIVIIRCGILEGILKPPKACS